MDRIMGDAHVLISVIIEADRALQIVANTHKGTYELYELLRRIVERLVPVDAFYVCLYSQDDGALFFAYNYDGDGYNHPVTMPLGGGPTSWVIHNRRPFLLSAENAATHQGGIEGGDRDREPRSAVHIPMRFSPGTEAERIVGVLSAQSYLPDAYDADLVAIVQWLADRAARILVEAERNSLWQRRAEAAEALVARHRREVISLTHEFVQTLKALTREVEALHAHVPEANASLREAIERVCQFCYGSQTEANQLPLRRRQLMGEEAPAEMPPGITNREREILHLLSLGEPYAQIAQRLHISLATVKFHCKNLFRKLGVSGRLQAVQMSMAISFTGEES